MKNHVIVDSPHHSVSGVPLLVLSAISYDAHPSFLPYAPRKQKNIISSYWSDRKWQQYNNLFLAPNYQDLLILKLKWNRYFVTKNCSDVRKNCFSDREKLEIRGWRKRIFKNFEITRTIYSNSESSEHFLVTECFFNFFLEVSRIWWIRIGKNYLDFETSWKS